MSRKKTLRMKMTHNCLNRLTLETARKGLNWLMPSGNPAESGVRLAAGFCRILPDFRRAWATNCTRTRPAHDPLTTRSRYCDMGFAAAPIATTTVASTANITIAPFRYVRCAEVFQDARILHSLSAKLSWTHFRRIIYLDDPLKRDLTATARRHQCHGRMRFIYTANKALAACRNESIPESLDGQTPEWKCHRTKCRPVQASERLVTGSPRRQNATAGLLHDPRNHCQHRVSSFRSNR